VAVFTEPLAIAIHAVDRAHIKLGDTVVVQGSGTIGLLTFISAKLAGAGKVIVVGRRRKERLELARKLSADLTLNMEEIPEQEERIRIIKKNSLSGYGADVVFECAGAPAAFSEGIKYLRDSATLCEVGHFADAGSVKINPCLDILSKNIRIEGIYDNEPEQFVRAIPILEKGEFPFANIISHRLPLTRLKEAMEAILTGAKIDDRELVKAVIEPEKG
jgi:L-iditol 2-dehydrogenase